MHFSFPNNQRSAYLILILELWISSPATKRMRLPSDVAHTADMQTQRKYSICGGVGHNSRGCTARPGTVAAPPASAEEGGASDRTLKRAHSGGNACSESDSETEQSAQRKERKRGMRIGASASLLAYSGKSDNGACRPTCRAYWCRQPLDEGGAPAVPRRAEKAGQGQCFYLPIEFGTVLEPLQTSVRSSPLHDDMAVARARQHLCRGTGGASRSTLFSPARQLRWPATPKSTSSASSTFRTGSGGLHSSTWRRTRTRCGLAEAVHVEAVPESSSGCLQL